MFDDVVRLASYQLHLEKAESRIYGIEFVYDCLDLLVFLLNVRKCGCIKGPQHVRP